MFRSARFFVLYLQLSWTGYLFQVHAEVPGTQNRDSSLTLGQEPTLKLSPLCEAGPYTWPSLAGDPLRLTTCPGLELSQNKATLLDCLEGKAGTRKNIITLHLSTQSYQTGPLGVAWA